MLVRNITRSAALAGATALFVAAAAAPTFAAANEDPSDPGTRSVCSAGWFFTPQSRGADTFSKVGPTYSNDNGTPYNASMTLSSTVTGTVYASVSGSTNVGLSVKVASVATTYGISSTASMSVTTGNSITITVPPNATGNGDYGAWRADVRGVDRYQTANCAITQTLQTTIYAPYRRGWNTWIS